MYFFAVAGGASDVSASKLQQIKVFKVLILVFDK
jgi:hypothetical protein